MSIVVVKTQRRLRILLALGVQFPVQFARVFSSAVGKPVRALDVAETRAASVAHPLPHHLVCVEKFTFTVSLAFGGRAARHLEHLECSH